MNSVLFGGKPTRIKGGLPKVGKEAPDFTFVKSDMKEQSLFDYTEKVKIVLGIPSVETGVCQTEMRKFNEKAASMEDVKVLFVSKDLPFAQKRFCAAEGIDKIEVGSDYRYNDFNDEFGTEILEGNFKGLSARCAFVLDENNIVRYAELVPEIGQEPNYEAILEAVEKYA